MSEAEQRVSVLETRLRQMEANCPGYPRSADWMGETYRQVADMVAERDAALWALVDELERLSKIPSAQETTPWPMTIRCETIAIRLRAILEGKSE